MSKMGELSAILDQMIDCGNGMVQAAMALKEFYSSTEGVKPAKKEKVAETPVEQEKEEAPSAEPEKTYSKEDIRAMLSGKASESEGAYKTVVKDLVKKYADGGTLKDIPSEKYAALVAELEVIANG